MVIWQRAIDQIQSIISINEYPKNEIQNHYEHGFSLSSLCCGNNIWYVLMNKSQNVNSQRIFHSQDFPKDNVLQLYHDDYLITFVSYRDGIWIVVMSKQNSMHNSIFDILGTFSFSGIENHGDNNFFVHL
jgi:hypothetical protein